MSDKNFVLGLNQRQVISALQQADFLTSVGIWLDFREETLSKLTEMYKDCSVVLKTYTPPSKTDTRVAITSGLAGVGLFAAAPLLNILTVVPGAIAMSVGYTKFMANTTIGYTYAQMIRQNEEYARTMRAFQFENIAVQKIKSQVFLLRMLLTFDYDKHIFLKVATKEGILPQSTVTSLIDMDKEAFLPILGRLFEGVRGMVSMIESLSDAPNIPALFVEFQQCSNEYFLEVSNKLERIVLTLKREYEEMRTFYDMLKGV